MNNNDETAGDYRCQFGEYDEDGDEISRCPEQIIPERVYCQTHADLADDIRDRMAETEDAYGS